MASRVRGGGDNQSFSVTMPKSVVARLDEMAERSGSSRAGVVLKLVLAGMDREALVERIAAAIE